MSLPRDLKVKVPGAGTNKINAAYEIGGPRKTVATIKRLFEDATGEEFPINNVINVNFGGFRRAVNYVDGVYVDVDRRYYNDNTTAGYGEAYATIDVAARLPAAQGPGRARLRPLPARRQRLLPRLAPAGLPAPDHAPGQRSARCWTSASARSSRASSAATSRSTSPSRRPSNLIGLARTGQFLIGQKAPVNEVRFPAYEAENPAIDSYLYVKDSALRKTFDEFMTGKGSSSPRKATETTQVRRDARRPSRPASATSRRRSRASSRRASRARTWPSWPRPRASSASRSTSRALRKTGSRYADSKPRIYTIPDAQRQEAQGLPAGAQRGHLRRVLRRPGPGLEGPADPRRPGRHAHRRTAAS